MLRAVEVRCGNIMKEAREHAESIRTRLHVEMCKIPKEVQSMPLTRFREEYGEDPQAFGRAFLSRAVQQTFEKNAGSAKRRSKG
jgi:hypothetical protein